MTGRKRALRAPKNTRRASESTVSLEDAETGRTPSPERLFPCLPSLGEHCGECHRCTPADEGRGLSSREQSEALNAKSVAAARRGMGRPTSSDDAASASNSAANSGRSPSLWTVEAEGDDCPLCFHGPESHDGEACSVEEGYDHLNGSHECGCPMTAPARKSS